MIKQKKYSGITVPVLTPVLADETVDEQGYRTLIKYMLDNGVHGIFSCGTLGETMGLTQAERDRAIRIFCQLTDCSREEAQAALEANEWNIRRGIQALKKAR